MALNTGKIDRKRVQGRSMRFIKNQTARKLRRLGRRLLDAAPTRVTAGYAD